MTQATLITKIAAGHLMQLDPETWFVTNLGILLTLMRAQPELETCREVHIRYLKNYFAHEGDIAKIYSKNGGVYHHVDAAEETVALSTWNREVTNPVVPSPHPHALEHNGQEEERGGPYSQVNMVEIIKTVGSMRDTHFAPTQIADFLAHVKSGEFWLWTRSARYVTVNDALTCTQISMWATPHANRCLFKLHCVLSNTDTEGPPAILAAGEQEIAVTKDGKLQRVSSYPYLVEFLRNWTPAFGT